MTKLNELIGELEELEKKRTPGPWNPDDAWSDEYSQTETDCYFIAKTANSLSTLLKIIKMQQKALKQECRCISVDDYFKFNCCACQVLADGDKLCEELVK